MIELQNVFMEKKFMNIKEQFCMHLNYFWFEGIICTFAPYCKTKTNKKMDVLKASDPCLP